GIRVATTPAEAVDGADLALLSLADAPAVEDVLFGLGGLIWSASDRLLVVDTSTVSPTQSRDLTARVAAQGVRRVEACLVGNAALARTGALRIITSGDDVGIDAAAPILSLLGTS